MVRLRDSRPPAYPLRNSPGILNPSPSPGNRITKAGNSRARRTLVESAWTYRYPPRIGKVKLYHLQRVTPAIRDIAWKAQSRLCARFRALAARGKKSTVAVTAVARELAAFMWAIVRAVPAT